MIRRELTSASGEKLWLLISQVEHAHVSGALMHHWKQEPSPEVIDAITHHDDGWAAWEAEPKLNPDLGAPFSFLEMPIPAALVIWDHSINAVGQYGPLASYIVAGHFYNLLQNSEHASDPLATAWLTAKRKMRTTWLDAWVRSNPSHTLEEAKQAQQMLLIADLFSLWLCCDCPADRDEKSILGHSPMKLQTDTLLNQFRFDVPAFTIEKSPDGRRIDELKWTVAVHPYPFNIVPLRLFAAARAAPAVPYKTWDDLKAASWPVTLHWQLVGGSPVNGAAA